jgi:hypothetical protein
VNETRVEAARASKFEIVTKGLAIVQVRGAEVDIPRKIIL